MTASGHDHDHSAAELVHVHGHGLEGGWSEWLRQPMLRIVVAALAAVAVATIVGLVALWPDGEGRDEIIDRAEQFGVVSDRLSATVTEITDARCSYSTEENPEDCRTLVFEVHEGPEAGSVVALPERSLAVDPRLSSVSVGDDVILGYVESTNTYFYADNDRRTSLVWLAALFAIAVVALGRRRGGLALAAMAVTVAVLIGFVAPAVLDGSDPVLVSVTAAAAIAFVTLYLTHGFSPTTTVALAGTIGALLLTLALAAIFFEVGSFTGLATEEALVLPFIGSDVDLTGLLLGGTIIGALGALDDVTVTQVATVAEVKRAAPHMARGQLIASGIRVGQEHIASTVNTLLLAYAGASMPLLLLFVLSDQSLSTIANSELIAVEIVRTLTGSIGLVAAVPITTALAAIVVSGDQEDAGPGGDVEPGEPDADETQPAAAPAVPPTPPEPPPKWEDFAPED